MAVIGMVVAYAGTASNVPAGWLLCDGSLKDVSQYKDLFGVIGNNFGTSPDPSKFYLPDLRGRFVRGTDLGTGRDPDCDKRVDSQKNDVVVGSKVGSLQLDALQSHEHKYTVFPKTDGNIASGTYWAQGDATTFGLSDGTRASAETRPVNIYLNYIIQYA